MWEIREKELKRFYSKFSKNKGCWVWEGWLNNKGYGRFDIKRNGKWCKVYAHRYSYQIHKEKIHNKKNVLHTCDNPKGVL